MWPPKRGYKRRMSAGLPSSPSPQAALLSALKAVKSVVTADVLGFSDTFQMNLLICFFSAWDRLFARTLRAVRPRRRFVLRSVCLNLKHNWLPGRSCRPRNRFQLLENRSELPLLSGIGWWMRCSGRGGGWAVFSSGRISPPIGGPRRPSRPPAQRDWLREADPAGDPPLIEARGGEKVINLHPSPLEITFNSLTDDDEPP
ncbi:hypothetical protein XENOCAPTIV_018659 [Xenoophorus captivus]|uniref:Uncharacterized protein n=1 Tax=Xenoophorus captivus TaxID=1517983 RepID=A0ABV0Q5E8_9TELE